MTKELTEDQFIEMFSSESYNTITMWAYTELSKTQEFKNRKPFIASLMVFPIKKDGVEYSLITESTYKRSGQSGDFGFTKMILSDEQMPDVALDRYSDYLKAKEKII